MNWPLPIIESPLFWICAVPAVLLNGIAKAGLGGSVGSIAVPLMALTVAPARAAAIMLPILVAMDLLNLWSFRQRWDRQIVQIVLPGALLGVLIGWTAFAWLEPRWVRILLGLECIVFATERIVHAAAHQAAQPAPVDRRKGLFWGAAAGITSFIAHAGGPPMLQFLLPLKLAREIHVGTMIVLFGCLNFVKLPIYKSLGLMNPTELATSLMLLPLVPLGTWVGTRLLRAIRPEVFVRVITWGMLLTGIQLLAQAI